MLTPTALLTNTECYTENGQPEHVLAWLQQRLGPLRRAPPQVAGTWFYQLVSNDTRYHDLQLQQLEAGVLGVWWLPAAPWSTQLAFAREVAQALGCRVWCSGEEVGLDPSNPYLWWCIGATGEGPATWLGPAEAY